MPPLPEDKIVPAQDQPIVEQPKQVQEQTIQEALGDQQPAPAPQAEAKHDTVPLATHLELKRAAKDAEKRARDAEARLSEFSKKGGESTDDLDALAEEFPDVDPNFIKRFDEVVDARVRKTAEREVGEQLRPLEAKERAAEIDRRFNSAFDRVLEANPEFKDVANRAVIKTMSLAPENANKTFTNLLEEAYGHLLTGKRTMDPSTGPRSTRDEGAGLDFARAQNDPKYFAEQVLTNPSLKKEYNDKMFSIQSSRL